MPITPSTALESDILKGIQNREVITTILNQIDYYSKVLPSVETIDIDGDTGSVVGLKSREPKQWGPKLKSEDFEPNEALKATATIEAKDKLIFYTVFSESIEKLAVGEKIAETLAKQSDQVAYDAAV
jgi:hypothetical protein